MDLPTATMLTINARPAKGYTIPGIARKREKASSFVGNIRSIKRYRELRTPPPDKQIAKD
jgi:hypothetical protein